MKKLSIHKILLLFSVWVLSNSFAHADGIISGFVFDASNGEALIGTNVYLEEIQMGSSTNNNGYYVITNIPEGNYTLVCAYIGYKNFSQKIQIKQNENIRLQIKLNPEFIEGETITVFADSVSSMDRLFDRAISKTNFTPLQIEKIPQVAVTDLLRSIQTLPGIVPVSDYSSAPYVRGGTPDQNLYLIDGADVYNPEHAFGLFSVFNTHAIKKVEIYKGGFGAQYGGRLSSIMNITHLDGNRENFEGNFSLNLLSAKSTVQVPLGSFGSFSGSFRRTYFDQTIAKMIDDIPDYYFYDGNFKAFFDLNPNNNLTISGFGGYDNLSFNFNEDSPESENIQYHWGNKTGSIRWTTVFSPQLFANFWITGSRFNSGFDLSQAFGFNETNKVTDITYKGNLEYSNSRYLDLQFGFEQKNLQVVYKQEFPDAKTNINKSPKHYAAYLKAEVKPHPLWEVIGGLRYNFFNSDTNYSSFAPRFSVKHRLTNSINLKAAAGIYYQYLNRIPRAFISDIWTVANRFQKPSSSRHYILGYQQEFSKDIELEVEAFYKTYENIYSFNDAFLATVSTNTHENGIPVYKETSGLFHNGNGNSKGVELLLKKSRGVFNGWLGYSYSQTQYTFDDINRGNPFAPRHDKTSTLNMVGNVEIKNLYRILTGEPQKTDKNLWLFGANFVYSSGQPITRAGSGYVINSLPDYRGIRNIFTGDHQYFVMYPGKINDFRLPPYIRLDINFSYKRQYEGWSMTSYLQVFNVGNRKNVWFIQYEDESQGFDIVQNIKKFSMFPILPSMGLQIDF